MLNNYQMKQSVLNYIEQNSDVTKLRTGQTTTWLKLFEKELDEIRKHIQMRILSNYCGIA